MSEKPVPRVWTREESLARRATRKEQKRLEREAGLASAMEAVARGERERFDFGEFSRRYKWEVPVVRPRAEHEQYWSETYYLGSCQTIDEYIERFYEIEKFDDPFYPPFQPPWPDGNKSSAETEWEAAHVFEGQSTSIDFKTNYVLASAELLPGLDAHFLAEPRPPRSQGQTAIVGFDKTILIAEYGVAFEELTARYVQGERNQKGEPVATTSEPRPDVVRSFSDVQSIALQTLDVPSFRQIVGTIRRITGLAAFYVDEPEPGTRAMIIGYDGSILVSNEPFETHKSEFAKGKRTYNELPPTGSA